jgi:polysaccharide biosynthesis transport protein
MIPSSGSSLSPDDPGPEKPRPRQGVTSNPGLAGKGLLPSNLVPMTSLVEIAWRSRSTVALCTVLCMAAALAYLLAATPKYTSESRIYVEQAGPQLLENTIQTRQSDSYLYTQAELLKSTPVLAMAVQSLSSGRLKTFQDVDNPTIFLKKRLEVSVGKKDDIIGVSIELPDSQEAAQIVNSVVDAYVMKYTEKKRSTTVEVLKILQNEKMKRDGELEQRSAAIHDFREKNADLTIEDDKGNVITKRFALLSEELTHAQLELIQAKAKCDSFAATLAAPQQRAGIIKAAVAQGLIKRDEFLQQQVHALELSLSTESKRLGPMHPKVKKLREPLEELRERMNRSDAEVEDAYVRGLEQDYALQQSLLKAKTEELQRNYDSQLGLTMQVNTKASKYLTLQDALRRTEKLCDILDDRIKELNVAENAGALNISILEVAQPGEKPTSPRKAAILGLGILAGLFFGFGLALLRNLLDHRLRSSDEITAMLELPLLGVVPHISGKHDRSDLGQMVANRPRSEVAEAFRTLRTAIHFNLPEGQAKTILITSPSSGDGKSMIASNLAIAMARADQTVLLIEADFRKPTQALIFELKTECGFSDVLTRQEPLDDMIMETGIKGLSILPCGPLPHSPAEIINSQGFRQALEVLSRRFDKIIIDSPPVMPVADARILGALCDITVMVLRAEKSTRRHSLVARNELQSVGAKILGVVVNSAPAGHGSYGYGLYGYNADGDSNRNYRFDNDPNRKAESDGNGALRKQRVSQAK